MKKQKHTKVRDKNVPTIIIAIANFNNIDKHKKTMSKANLDSVYMKKFKRIIAT